MPINPEEITALMQARKVIRLQKTLYKVHHQNPQIEKFKQKNVFNEKLNIIKNPFIWHLGDPCTA